MIPKLTMVGGAAHRQPTPETGDLDIRIKYPTCIKEEWKKQLSNPETLELIRTVSSFIWYLWGEPIKLDLGVTDGKWTVVFRNGRPHKRLPFKKFDWEYCV